jgi:uncharacterized membrane protein
MLLGLTVNLDHFIRDLMEGDPFVWTLVVVVVIATVVGAYQKYRARSNSNAVQGS